MAMMSGTCMRLLAALLLAAVGAGLSPAADSGGTPHGGAHTDGDTEDTTLPTIPPPPPTPTTGGSVIELQEQIYIISGVLGFFLLVLLIVSLAGAYLVISVRHKVRILNVEAQPGSKPSVQHPQQQALGGYHAPTAGPSGPPPRARQPPQQVQGRDNRAFMDNEDDESGDEVNQRYSQYPGAPAQQGRDREVGGRARGGQQPYDRFHQPMPGQFLPSEERERQQRERRDDPNSRYGEGNLARLPKGPAPQPAGYDRGYPVERRPRSPVHAQW